MKRTPVEKYFTQKEWTVIEIICVAFIIIGAILFTFVWNAGPIGIAIFLVALVVLLISKSSKIKAADVDAAKAKLLSDEIINRNSNNCIEMYDPLAEYTKIGKDKVLRSTEYVVSVFDFKNDSTDIHVTRADLLQGSIEREVFTVTSRDVPELTDEVFTIGGVRKTVQFIKCPPLRLSIPVTTNDIDSSSIVEKLCKK